jgi:hypothetical protein
MSVAAPAGRVTRDVQRDIISALTAAARWASQQLGHLDQ